MERILFTALVTPMLSDGSIDYSSLKDLALYQDKNKCNILLLGSTGESFSLTLREKLKIVEFIFSLSLRIDIMVGIGGNNLSHQLKIIEYSNKKKIYSYLFTSPVYLKPPSIGQILWFEKLIENSAHNCMLYNIPSRSGTYITTKTLTLLEKNSSIFSIKESTNSLNNLKKLHNCLSLDVYNGEDSLLLSSMKYKIYKNISVISNIWPKEIIYLLNSDSCINISSTYFIKIWDYLVKSCFTLSNPTIIKCWLKELGLIKTDIFRLPLTNNFNKSYNILYQSNFLIRKWYQRITKEL